MATLNGDSTTRGRRWRLRKKSIKNRKDAPTGLTDSISGTERDAAPMYFGEIQAAKLPSIKLPFSRDRKQSTEGVTYMGQQPPFPDKKAETNVSGAVVNNPPQLLDSFPPVPRRRKRSKRAELNQAPPSTANSQGTIESSQPLVVDSSARSGGFFKSLRNRKCSAGSVENHHSQPLVLPSAMRSSASLAQPKKKVSFSLPFTQKRNPSSDHRSRLGSMPVGMQSSPSLIQSTSKKPSSIPGFFRNRKASTIGKDEVPSDQSFGERFKRPFRDSLLSRNSSTPANELSTARAAPSGSSKNPGRQSTPAQAAMGSSPPLVENPSKKPSSIVDFLRDRKRSIGAKMRSRNPPDVPNSQTSGTGTNTNSLPGKRGVTGTMVSGQPLAPASPPRTLNAHAPEFIPRGGINRSTNVPAGIFVAIGVPPSPESKSTSEPSISTGSPTAPTESSATKLSNVYVPPHRRGKKTPAGIFLKPVASTVPFPIIGNAPEECPPEIDSNTTGEAKGDTEFSLTEDSKYLVGINLLSVLWTEAKLQDNLQIQQDISRCCSSRNSSQPSPELSVLDSALYSQQYLLGMAAILSLEEAKISAALCEDRRKIRDCLIAAQSAILDRAKAGEADVQCILDLAQDVLDHSEPSDGFDSKLNRIAVKLSLSCGKLPSSLSIKKIEQKGQHAVSRGGFGDIFKAVYRSKPVALKQLRFYQDYTQEERRRIHEKFCQEALLWKNLNHHFVIPFIGVYSDEDESDPLRISMVCPWMQNGTVLAYLPASEATSAEVFLYEIAEGLQYLHSQLVVHGDLRGENILVDDDGHARLADFGLASYANATVKSSARAGSTSDVYAYACVCYELCTGAYPFSDIRNDPTVMFEVIAGRRPRRMPSIPAQTWQVIQACWPQEPEKRLTAPSIVEKLETIKKDTMERRRGNSGAGTSSVEPHEVYRPPRSLCISQNGESTLSLPRTSSLVVNVLSPQEKGPWRRNSTRSDLFGAPTRATELAQTSWRQGRRAISMIFGKGNLRSASRTDMDIPRSEEEPKRRRIISLRI
ncbi:hypothetical protein DFH07DRAFT_307868 [Mycena maculata]|uniref:Protein kinase domain-containing protein n=1 Tax=Mycena maculata TaxID=230809 RepID=A0AAD7MJK6_9AGAR|nr:hypothetical protein DFH07DRAFT_307868 [Mycena maculata]